MTHLFGILKLTIASSAVVLAAGAYADPFYALTWLFGMSFALPAYALVDLAERGGLDD